MKPPAPVHLSRVSTNVKTGPIPVSTSARATCPPTCKLKGNGCYAENFPMSTHWDAVSNGSRGVPYADFVEAVKYLPKGQLWRHNQAGDLAGHDNVIDAKALLALVRANVGKKGFSYTHFPPIAANRKVVKTANDCGFTINWSADSLAQADTLLAMRAGPVVAIVPPGWKGDSPAGNKVTVCPAQRMDNMTCAICQLCANPNRHAIVAFEAHGGRKGAVMKTFQLQLELT
jgi:hypothetical protein